MDQVIKTKLDLNTIINSSENTLINLKHKSKFIDKLNNSFTEHEQKWYIANLYYVIYYLFYYF